MSELLISAAEARRRGEHRTALGFSARAVRHAEQLGNDALVALALGELALNQVRLGELAAAMASGQRALAHCQVQQPSALGSRIHGTLSLAYDATGLRRFAVSHASRALEIARDCQDPTAECWALIRLGGAERDTRSPGGDRSTLAQAVALARGLPDREALFAALNNLSRRWVLESDRLAESGEDPAAALNQALALSQEVSQLPVVGESAFMAATSMSNLASIHRRLGQAAQARGHFRSALDIALHHGYDGLTATLRLALASLDLENDPSPQTRALVQRLLDTESIGKDADPDLQQQARQALMRAYRESDDLPAALAQMEQLHEALKSAQARRMDLQSRLLFNQTELDRARHAAELAQLDAQLQRLRANADRNTARQLTAANDQLEHQVALRTDELARAKAAAEAAGRVKSNFLATISHELRTPLNGVIGMVDLAGRRATDARQFELLQKAGASAWQLNSVLGNILDFVAADADAPTLPTVTDLCALFDISHRKWLPAAQAKGLDLQLELAESLPIQVQVDGVQLSRIVDALLDNAIKFSPRGQLRLVASSDTLDGGRCLLRVAVFDRGPGVPPATLERLFRPFEMGDSTITREHGGLGLGLALAKRLADGLGGQVGVEVQPGEGNRFWLEFEVAVT